jgi:probable phosphoglycerate mutase
VETAEPIAKIHKLEIRLVPGLMDTDIGKWQGRSWKVLSRTKAWKVVQGAPSRFTFPGGESFLQAQMRIITALDGIVANHKSKDLIAVVFHADPIKLALAYYLGMPLDNFQRISIDTGSVTALMVGQMGAHLLWMNQKPPFNIPHPSKKKK